MPTPVRNETGERDALLTFLDAQRGGIRRSVLGLTDEQAVQRPTVSALTLDGLLRHAAAAERGWVQGTPLGGPEPDSQGFELTAFELVAMEQGKPF